MKVRCNKLGDKTYAIDFKQLWRMWAKYRKLRDTLWLRFVAVGYEVI